MDTKRILGLVGVAFGSALVVLGLFLKWWIPEEGVGWYPMATGTVLVLGAILLLRSSPDPLL